MIDHSIRVPRFSHHSIMGTLDQIMIVSITNPWGEDMDAILPAGNAVKERAWGEIKQ